MLSVIRHGRTEANASGLLLGHLDPILDATGLAQAGAVGKRLSGAGPVDLIVSSPLRRTMQTAESIAAACGVEVTADERFIELDYGEWDGRPLTEVTVAQWTAWRSDVDFAPPGGESLGALGVRVRDALDDVAERAREQHVVVVTHVSPIKASVAWALGVGDEVSWRMFVAPASITTIAVGGGGGRSVPSLQGFNDTRHLP